MRRDILIDASFRACVLPAKLSLTYKSTIKNEEGELKKGGEGKSTYSLMMLRCITSTHSGRYKSSDRFWRPPSLLSIKATSAKNMHSCS